MNLRDYWLIIRRRRLIIIASTVLVALLSFWFAKQKVPLYQATAAVRFEQSTQLSGLLVEVLSYSSADNIETQVTLIKSYPILEEVARRLGRLPQAAAGGAVRELKGYWAALDAISAKVKVTRVPTTSILEIMATSTNPREARDLANSVAEVYRDYNRQQRNLRVTEARKFIETQLKEVEARVKRAESEVWAFREANRIISPGAESTVLLSLFTQVRGDIEKARQQRTELELGALLPGLLDVTPHLGEQGEQHRRLGAGRDDAVGLAERPHLGLSPLDARLDLLELGLDELPRFRHAEVPLLPVVVAVDLGDGVREVPRLPRIRGRSHDLEDARGRNARHFHLRADRVQRRPVALQLADRPARRGLRQPAEPSGDLLEDRIALDEGDLRLDVVRARVREHLHQQARELGRLLEPHGRGGLVDRDLLLSEPETQERDEHRRGDDDQPTPADDQPVVAEVHLVLRHQPRASLSLTRLGTLTARPPRRAR